jgi:hypothetical protein
MAFEIFKIWSLEICLLIHLLSKKCLVYMFQNLSNIAIDHLLQYNYSLNAHK